MTRFTSPGRPLDYISHRFIRNHQGGKMNKIENYLSDLIFELRVESLVLENSNVEGVVVVSFGHGKSILPNMASRYKGLGKPSR